MTGYVVDTSGAARTSSSFLEDHPIDPYEIAYLRGGAQEVLKLRLFDLLQMGHLVVAERKRWFGMDQELTLAPNAATRQGLADIDKHLLAYCETPRTATEILSLRFPTDLEIACRSFRQELRQRGLLSGAWPPPESKTLRRTGIGIYLLFCFLFGAASVVTQSPMPALVGWGALVFGSVLLYAAFRYQPSVAGTKYLQMLAGQHASFAKFYSATWEGASPTTRLTAVAVFGFAILKGSPADALGTLLGTEAKGGVQYGVESGGGCSGCEGHG